MVMLISRSGGCCLKRKAPQSLLGSPRGLFCLYCRFIPHEEFAFAMLHFTGPDRWVSVRTSDLACNLSL